MVTSSPILNHPKVQTLAECLRAGRACRASGLWGSSSAALAAALVGPAPGPVLLITPSGGEADDSFIDALFFLPEKTSAEVFPAWESLPSDDIPLNRDILAQRVRILQSLQDASLSPPKLVIAPVQALQEPVLNPQALADSFYELRAGEDPPPEGFTAWLVDRGFERLPQVEASGEFSVRGGILDVFPLGAEAPVRIEYFGDTVDSIRQFDPSTQRSTADLDLFRVLAIDESTLHHLKSSGSGVPLLEYFPDETWVFVKEPAEVQRKAQALAGSQIAQKELYSYSVLQSLWRQRPNLSLSELPEPKKPDHEDFVVRSVERFSGNLDTLAEELNGLVVPNDRVAVVCQNEGERDRLQELLSEGPLAGVPDLDFPLGSLTRGFEMDDIRMAFVAHHEIFHRYQGQLRPTRRRKKSAPVEDWLDLEPGDLVVHVVNGIARYHGMERFERNGEMAEFLVLEFAEGTKIYVPVTHIDLVQRYVGPMKSKPNLSKLGSSRWAKKKEEVQGAVEDLALELLRLQAVRESNTGTQFPPDDRWQGEFEAEFPFEATEDQLSASGTIKDDMESIKPMDRLLCGDVGFGKTEVAMRAAFKTVMYGKQVGILVPTTILAQQHYRTFSERMADYPITIDVISRFRSKQEQNEILERTKKGGVDVLIGTHRIIQKDVEFRDLGLLIIDEEQRFGVEQKEFLKWARQTIDVLTMTATPIPRTLHMALTGIRDISALNTPPPDRQSIRTEVCRFDRRLIRDAILREMKRGGQVFFLHNLVYNIHELADKLAEIVPEANIVIGHGQMPEGELERNMTDFINRLYDILVCTTIIGSGVDIPNVNTIFIHNADRFGLAEAHQLRGRVGRYKHRAYAYFLIPEDRPITPKALRRLKAIEEFSELGVGFKIAMRDLEIRGAGNILGPEQSGHIGAVGYDLYCKLLDVTVRQLRSEPFIVPMDVRVELGFPAFLPDDYVPSDRQKMEIYRRISRSHGLSGLDDLEIALVDRFGKLPDPVRILLYQARLRVLAQPWKVGYIRRLEDRIELRTMNAKAVAHDLQVGRDLVRHVDARTVHVLFPDSVTEPFDICDFAVEVLATKAAEIPTGAAVIPTTLVDGLRPLKSKPSPGA